MKGVIRLGDPHSHGGIVISASGANFDGKPVALVGDTVSCPKKGHGVNAIIEGHPTWIMHNRAVAVNGCHTACGCILMSTLTNVGSES
ncbi:PAAR domain-containing protein [Gilliamella sp. B3172]|uniref:PAAR domain-containing protein n=1 Tax=Gilliamella sp. B3172 TaxID=2818006 RepID=UPI00226A0D67|nr:PAAR domain-containing protein [Gilliamella sp. B3172]MCX8639084.1 PAAR domain-containing protein [Gilliamella sp. B3172]